MTSVSKPQTALGKLHFCKDHKDETLMANANDPQAIASERVRLNAQQTTLAAAISAWTGDQNGLTDLRIKIAEGSFRLNRTSTGGNMSRTSFAGFDLEQIST